MQRTCVEPLKHLLNEFLKASSSSVPTVRFVISLSVKLSAISFRNDLYASVVELWCMNVGPKLKGWSLDPSCFLPEVSLYKIGEMWNSPRLYVLSIPRTPASSLQQNRLMSLIC